MFRPVGYYAGLVKLQLQVHLQSNTKLSTLKIYIQVTFYRLSIQVSEIHTHTRTHTTYIHISHLNITTTNKKRGHEFERGKEEIYSQVLWERGKQEIMSSYHHIKKKEIFFFLKKNHVIAVDKTWVKVRNHILWKPRGWRFATSFTSVTSSGLVGRFHWFYSRLCKFVFLQGIFNFNNHSATELNNISSV